MKTLTQHYREDIEGMTSKERKARRALWHNTAKRYCTLLELSSDPLPPLKTERVTLEDDCDLEIITKNGVYHYEAVDEYVVTVKPVDMIGVPRFLKAEVDELIDLFRLTTPRSNR
jgi:hypothetical protein